MELLNKILKHLMNAIPNGPGDEASFYRTMSAAVDVQAVDFEDLARALVEHAGTGDTNHAMVAEMIAVWMCRLQHEQAAEQGQHVLQTLISKGSVSAMFNLAVARLEKATHVSEEKECADLIKKVVVRSRGNARLFAIACKTMGDCHQLGRGRSRSVAEALRWYRRGADAGNAEAAFNCGLAYDEKNQPIRVFSVNFERAAHYYRIAADQGMLAAMTNLGIIHLCREFPGRNAELGKDLLERAAAGGDHCAVEALDLVGGGFAQADALRLALDDVLHRMLGDAYCGQQPTPAQAIKAFEEAAERLQFHFDRRGEDGIAGEAQMRDQQVREVLLEEVSLMRVRGQMDEARFERLLVEAETVQGRRAIAMGLGFRV